jgi:acetyltransferase (GNAT) family protein
MIGVGAPIATPVVRHAGWFQERFTLTPERSADPATVGPQVGSAHRSASPAIEGAHRRVEYSVRAARITDIDRFVALSGDRLGGRVAGQPAAADILRQLVFLPHATVLVAERKRDVIGGAVLAIRPSVAAGGFVGTIDLLVVDPTADPDDVTESLVEEALRSAANKGCASVEAAQPEDPAERARWERLGFEDQGPRIGRAVGPKAPAR